MNQNPERMTELVKVTNPVVMLYSSYSEEGVEGDCWQKAQNERGRRGLLVDLMLQTQESSLS